MNILEIVKLSIKNLFSFKFRSFLTMLGIIIGISSVVILSSLGSGFQQKIVGDIDNTLGNLIGVDINRKYIASNKVKKNELFTKLDVTNILNLGEFEVVDLSTVTNLVEKSTKKNVVVYGGGNNYIDVYDKKITKGIRFIENSANTILISKNTENNLFKGKNPIGQKISLVVNELRTDKYTVIGVYDGFFDKQAELFGSAGFPFEVVVEKGVVEKYNNNLTNTFYEIVVRPKKNGDTKKQIEVLKKYLKTKSDKDDFYRVAPLSKNLSEIKDTINKVSIFINLVAGVAIVVGGIGVMNIMLVSVKERITEIGLRKAIGAKNRDIMVQFLIETIIITLIGGLIGIILGYTIALTIGKFLRVLPILELKIVVISFVISSLTGLIFGIYPAKQASKLSPMEALRKD